MHLCVVHILKSDSKDVQILQNLRYIQTRDQLWLHWWLFFINTDQVFDKSPQNQKWKIFLCDVWKADCMTFFFEWVCEMSCKWTKALRLLA